MNQAICTIHWMEFGWEDKSKNGMHKEIVGRCPVCVATEYKAMRERMDIAEKRVETLVKAFDIKLTYIPKE